MAKFASEREGIISFHLKKINICPVMRLLFALKLDSHYPEALPYVDSIRIRMPLF